MIDFGKFKKDKNWDRDTSYMSSSLTIIGEDYGD